MRCDRCGASGEARWGVVVRLGDGTIVAVHLCDACADALRLDRDAARPLAGNGAR
jgi:hypothetical protein